MRLRFQRWTRRYTDWARSSIELLLTQSIMSGYTDGSVRPNNNVTRAEAVKILYGIG